ncbi:MAG TPA: hypothetical protein VKZ46_05905, partial [Pedomonas sp.]|nr:hypothetical protein [Pedomonas sp.]
EFVILFQLGSHLIRFRNIKSEIQGGFKRVRQGLLVLRSCSMQEDGPASARRNIAILGVLG